MTDNRTKYLLTLVMAVVCVGSTATRVTANLSQGNPKTAEEYNNRGLDRQKSGDLEGAIADYTKALSLKSKPAVQATLYNNRANAFMANKHLDAVVADCSKAIDFEPKFPSVYNERGNARIGIGDPEAALADYSTAIA